MLINTNRRLDLNHLKCPQKFWGKPINSFLYNLEHLINVPLLKKVYQQLNKRKDLKIDKAIKARYEKNFNENLEELVRHIHKGEYQPLSAQSSLSAPANNKEELLAIRQLEDKLAQTASYTILNKLYRFGE